MLTLILWIFAAGGCSKYSGYDEYEVPEVLKIKISHDTWHELCIGFYVELDWANGTSWPRQYFYCAEPDYSPKFEYYSDGQAIVGIAEAQYPQDVLIVIDLTNARVYMSEELAMSDEDTGIARNLVSQLQRSVGDLNLHFRYEQAKDEPAIGK